MLNKKVATYARVSTGNQGTGLESQVRALRDYCARCNIKDFVIYQDENQSGMKQSRPALDRLMEDARAGMISTVIVYSFSRYARSVTHLLRALEEFKSLNCGFISITEQIDTNSSLGSAVFTILGAVSQLERDILAERVRNGLANAKAKGIRIGRKKIRPSELIRRLRLKGITYKEISRISGVSQGAIATELKQWEEEKKNGKETIVLEDDIPAVEIIEKAPQPTPEPIPEPIKTIRF
jgi:DNA invertase Pin-like site-specific DNA recombinase